MRGILQPYRNTAGAHHYEADEPTSAIYRIAARTGGFPDDRDKLESVQTNPYLEQEVAS